MKATLKRLDTNSAISLESLQPENPECFGVWLNASIGTDEGEGADDFQILACNRSWLDHNPRSHATTGERYILVEGAFDASSVMATLKARLEKCRGDSWAEIVAQVSKIGMWEFEDYKA